MDYNKVIEYLIGNWNTKVAADFERTIQIKLGVLAKYPSMGMVSQKITDVRSILITKHNRLYYRLKNSVIEVLRILDNRQNPTKILFSFSTKNI